jgi:diketogulonate reductase-like aldo/keto reductase
MHNVTLNNGVAMPILGFGVFQIPIPHSASRSWPRRYPPATG